MVRLIVGTLAGVITWAVAVTLLNLILRAAWPEYAAVEHAMTFSLSMMFARLVESGSASLLAGALAAWIARDLRAGLYSGAALLLIFVPIHYGLWLRFPIWYHFVFLISLPLLGWLGALLVRARLMRPSR